MPLVTLQIVMPYLYRSSGRDLLLRLEALNEMSRAVALGPKQLPSACMYTMCNAENKCDQHARTRHGLTRCRVTSLTLSDDGKLLSAGFSDSYVRIYSLTGKE